MIKYEIYDFLFNQLFAKVQNIEKFYDSLRNVCMALLSHPMGNWKLNYLILVHYHMFVALFFVMQSSCR